MAQLHCSAAFVPCLFLSNCPQLTSDKVLKLQANMQREAEPLASSPTLVFWWQGAIAGGQRLAPYAWGHLAELYGRREGLAALVLCFPSSLRCPYFPWAVLVFSVFTDSICLWCLLGVQQACGLTRHGVRRVKVKYKEMILYLGFYVGNGKPWEQQWEANASFCSCGPVVSQDFCSGGCFGLSSASSARLVASEELEVPCLHVGWVVCVPASQVKSCLVFAGAAGFFLFMVLLSLRGGLEMFIAVPSGGVFLQPLNGSFIILKQLLELYVDASFSFQAVGTLGLGLLFLWFICACTCRFLYHRSYLKSLPVLFQVVCFVQAPFSAIPWRHWNELTVLLHFSHVSVRVLAGASPSGWAQGGRDPSHVPSPGSTWAAGRVVELQLLVIQKFHDRQKHCDRFFNCLNMPMLIHIITQYKYI